MTQSSWEPIDCSKLRNRFWILRHGQSEANIKGLIASSPNLAISKFGLTTIGHEQVVRSIEQRREQMIGIDRIFTSDFRRARETAEVAAKLLNVPITEAVPLRERCFGEWEGQSDANYEDVWSADAEDAAHEQWGVESVSAVAYRMSQFIQSVDQSSINRTYLIVSHGDPLQILLTAANSRNLRLHRQMDPLKTAELRPLCEMR